MSLAQSSSIRGDLDPSPRLAAAHKRSSVSSLSASSNPLEPFSSSRFTHHKQQQEQQHHRHYQHQQEQHQQQQQQHQISSSPPPSSAYQPLLDDDPETSLLPKPIWIPYQGKATEGYINTMTDEVVVQRRVSFGRGGYGNIRRPSSPPIKAEEKTIDPDTGTTITRRRSSLWSLSSSPGTNGSTGRRASIVKFFGKFGSHNGESKEVVDGQEMMDDEHDEQPMNGSIVKEERE